MYRCEICKTVVPPNTPCTRIVVETREKEYPYHIDRRVRGVAGKRPNRFQAPIETSGKGHEIVREIVACPACARKYKIENETAAS